MTSQGSTFSGDDAVEVERVRAGVTYAHEQLREQFLKIKPLSEGTVLGVYLERSWDGKFREGGFLVSREGTLVSYSVTPDFLKDGFLTTLELAHMRELLKYFVEHLTVNVFTHANSESALSKCPLWFTVLWNGSGRVVPFGSSYGYKFKGHERFGGSASGSSFTGADSNVHLWAEYLNGSYHF